MSTASRSSGKGSWWDFSRGRTSSAASSRPDMLTLAIIKPDAVRAGKTGKILAHLEGAGFQIRAARLVKLTTAQAAPSYAVPPARPLYRPLADSMASGPALSLPPDPAD